MDSSEEGSLLVPATTRFRRSSEAPPSAALESTVSREPPRRQDGSGDVGVAQTAPLGAHPRTKATWPAAAVRQFYIHRLGNCPTSPASCTAMPGPPVVAMSVSHRGLSPQTALSVRGARSCAGRARHLDNAGNGRNQSSQMIGRTKLSDGQHKDSVPAAGSGI
ncbi:hypothetical protein MTO96_008464 [Rhipicephalus appendiculatus]